MPSDAPHEWGEDLYTGWVKFSALSHACLLALTCPLLFKPSDPTDQYWAQLSA